MQEQEHFENAPIVEAIIDLRITPSCDTSDDVFEQVAKVVADRYPLRNNIGVDQFIFGANESAPFADATRQRTGTAYTSEDGQKQFYAWRDGFTFRLLPPYDRWSTFRDEARTLWEVYCRFVQPQSVTRVAVRYVNRLDMPLEPVTDIKKYLRTFPEVSNAMPEAGLGGYFMQLQIPQSSLGSMLILNQALVAPSSPDVISVVLDIDLFSERPQQPWPIEDESVWTFLDQLRVHKNAIFRASITPLMEDRIR